MSARKAVILVSGGLDSATVLAMAASQGFECYALSFRYGQRHAIELDAARNVVAANKVKQHKFADIDLRLFGGSALTDALDVPKSETVESMGEGIPITYVPARNTIFLSFALAWAEVLGAYDIFIGVNALDYSGYPDCRPDFIAAYETMANLATAYGVENKERIRIHTPIIAMSKAEIITQGLALGVDYSLTRSCYDPTPEGLSCGHCDSCLLRLRGFAINGLSDPIPYKE
jgi:7-cyano-7-deazaguanine synthase